MHTKSKRKHIYSPAHTQASACTRKKYTHHAFKHIHSEGLHIANASTFRNHKGSYCITRISKTQSAVIVVDKVYICGPFCGPHSRTFALLCILTCKVFLLACKFAPPHQWPGIILSEGVMTILSEGVKGHNSQFNDEPETI